MTAPLKTIDDLQRLRDDLAARPAAEMDIRVCSTGCRARGALRVCQALEDAIAEAGLGETVRVVRTGCLGMCAGAVAVAVQPAGLFYRGVTVGDAAEIVERTVRRGEVLDRLCWQGADGPVPHREDIPFYRHQDRRVLANCGRIDPTSLDDALQAGAYASLATVLSGMPPEDVIEQVTASGLRGRGGAGFPTGRKWQLARAAAGEPKYVICNADEGDPGAFMDRALLEGDPHLVIEGMLIGAYAIGAARGTIYVRAEYPIAIEHTAAALAQARQRGLLGEDILGSGLDFEIEIRQGAGSFVCGEETSLIASIEGRRPMPRSRPPFPAVEGLYGKPTNINNVETWANVPRIIAAGPDAYAAVGTKRSKGTKIFALAGKVANTGLVEVPMGATLREIVFDIGGGIPRGRKFKAVQMGGPSGGCVPAQYLDRPIDYDSLREIGAIMGSGGLIVMDEATCMVDIARFFTEFVQAESCGKCVPCRVGTRRMLEILTRITNGQGELEDIDRLVALGEMIRDASLCGLGQTAPNPVLSTIRFFRHEYEAHIVEKRCPAHSCEALITTTCSSACPAHVNIPEYVALISEGRLAEALDVIRRRNPFASVCGRACDHPCERFCRRGDIDEPVGIRNLKRFATEQVTDTTVSPALRWHGPRSGKVAVIGSGPAGLSAGYFLALMGREVTVFEAMDVAGGVLRVGIPDYRLPREAVARDIDYIRDAGVEIRTGRKIESLQELRHAGFDAIFVAVGAHKGMTPGLEGEDLPGVWDALRFLREVSTGLLTEMAGAAVVIGGGNAAIDAARTALRLGAEPVTILYRRTRQEMPALPQEIEEAIMEGVRLHPLVAPIEILGEGRVSAVRCALMKLGPADEGGRRRPVPTGAEEVVRTDHVILAIGQASELDFVTPDGELVITRGRIETHPVTQRSGASDVFAGGDVVTGPATIVQAVAAGQRAAQAIDRFLGGKGELPITAGFASRRKPDESAAELPRQHPEAIPPQRRRQSFEEVLKEYTVEAARCEARRCLRCDLE
ncbi:MAG TPA: NADH-ubiquinone oxidoreductase-F iron-sulfur binding region domain-containing protein [Phycisphaerae bacterium]|nr:NADH-ubiquinone oxidoreductase-F iron-sulfur binding region domain-containing protein [Phycisphaerae bacterium]